MLPMNMEITDYYQSARLNDTEFKKLSKFIFGEYGIKMPVAKKTMLESRLQKRLRANDMTSFKEYCDLVFSPEGQNTEIVHMIDVVSTNKTDFFREPVHFDFMNGVILPEFFENYSGGSLKIWSAGCSSGEEAYSIAITVSKFCKNNKLFDYSILGTDISSEILQDAATAVYSEDKVKDIPLDIKKKYLLKSKNEEKRTVKIVHELRDKIYFQRLNFMDEVYKVPNNFDIIFCRNTLIYFERNTQEKVINKLCLKLKHGGYFFLGHSESVTGMNVPLEQIKPTICKKK